ncbi:hypothetical protein BO71DRAFT_399490 [Aspergillus ellipticus CBS 707.79]|uniref:Uncharacterized protein n=1 Tax=Aspergillus ellipticus CBS 707.79 TaxID=1448320 RepID=A0A319DZX5_9EURO|nr:hypothetical protein BO71DRAFT_399490 [Aspergillus ellipticus CBS 707.79]
MSNDKPQSPRHWHGNVGDRYEHHNVWVLGGPPQPFRRPSVPTTTAATATGPDSLIDRRVCLRIVLPLSIVTAT